jgi:nicotinamide-nucleotide amidase
MATGSELTEGASVDSNSAFLASMLGDLGARVVRIVTLPDDLEALASGIRESFSSSELVVMTGGLGPTEDDFTRLAAAKAFGKPLCYHRDLEEGIGSYMAAKGFQMPGNNLRQAWLPEGAMHIPNPRGTAPAFALRVSGRLAVFLPGVPHEARFLAKTALRRLVSESFPGRVRRRRTYTITAVGLGEGRVDAMLADLQAPPGNPSIGLSAGLYETKVRVTAEGRSEEEARLMAEPLLQEIEARLGPNCAGEGDLGILSGIARMISQKGLRLGIIDSLTQGLLARSLLPILPKECSAGAVTLPPGPLKGSLAQDYLYHEGATLVLSLSYQRPGPQNGSPLVIPGFGENEEQMTVLTHILLNPKKEKWLSGKSKPDNQFFQLTPLEGPPGTLTERARALAAFQLWSYLREGF